MLKTRRTLEMIGVRALLAAAALSASACGQDSVDVLTPSRAEAAGTVKPPVFHVRDSGFVHVGIGRDLMMQVSGSDAGHPLRQSSRALVPTTWASRDASVATVTNGVLQGRAQGHTWLVWSQSGASDSVPLVVSPAPVGYLLPHTATLQVEGEAVLLRAPAGDSLTFCEPSSGNTGLTVTPGGSVRATQATAEPVRCRSRNGLTLASYVTAPAASTPPQNPDPAPPPQEPEPTPPPMPSARQVALQLHRFAGAEASTVTSNAIPLPPGWARPATVDSILLRVGNVEVPVHIAALFGKHPDGSLRSVLVQADITPAMASDGAMLSIGAPRTRSRAALPSIPAPNTTGVLLPFDPDYLVSTELVGRTVTRANSSFGPAQFTRYEQVFDSQEQRQWSIYGAVWGQNMYDRVNAYFAFWVRTGNARFFERGARLALAYRRDYVEAANYGVAEWNTYLEGLATHYWLTGDERSREAVYKAGNSLHSGRGGTRLGEVATHPWMDNRIQSKVLGAKVLAIQLEAPPFGFVSDWKAEARVDLGRILSTQSPDGAYRWLSFCRESNNFMTGMLNSVLIDYMRHVEADARIPAAIERSLQWLRATQWRSGDLVFNYFSGPCSNGGPTPGSDLNGFFLEAIGWLAQTTGDRSWAQFGDLVLRGLMEKTWMDGSKQFNQAYNLSWRYHWYRAQVTP